MSLFKRNPPRVDVDALDRQTEEVKAFLDEERPRMTALAKWLEWRGNENGFGDDFEISVPLGGRS